MSMLTEDEARTKWCPQARIARLETLGPDDLIVAGCNTDALGRNRVPASCRCIASGCAMWRWGKSETRVIERRAMKAGEAKPEGFNSADPPHWLKVETALTHGYCGLAGRPEDV